MTIDVEYDRDGNLFKDTILIRIIKDISIDDRKKIELILKNYSKKYNLPECFEIKRISENSQRT